MKGLKIVALSLGALALLGILVVVLALTPSVQTWAVRKALADTPGITIEVGRVAAGWSEAELNDLRVAQPGTIITARLAKARYSLGDFLSGRKINAEQVTVEDVVVDLRPPAAPGRSPVPSGAPNVGTPRPSPGTPPPAPAPGGTTTPPPSFAGILHEAQLPVDLLIGSFSAKGRALLPGGQTATFDFRGTNLGTGQQGKLEWTLGFADAAQGAALQTLRATGTAAVQIGADRRITRVEIETTASATGPSLPTNQLKLQARAEQPATVGNEVYSVRLGLVRGAAVEPLLGVSAAFAAASREIAGTWELSVRPEQVSALLAGLNLPGVAATGTGKFTLQPDTHALSTTGNLQGRVANLEKISPQLGVVGSVQFATNFNGAVAGQVARLERFDLTLTGADGRKLAEIASLQPVSYHLMDKRATLSDPKAQLGRITVENLPLAWAQPFVSAVTIAGGDLSLTFAVEAEDNGSRILARAIEPLALRGVTLRQGQQVLLEQATLTLKPSIDYSATRVALEVADLNLTLPAGDAVTGRITSEITNLATTPAIAFNVQIQARTVAALKAYLPVDPGPLSVVAALEGNLEGSSLRLAKASLTANRANGGLLASLELQQPLTADLAKMTFAVAKPDAVAARLRLGEVPLAWAEKFVADAKFAGVLVGGAWDVSFQSADQLGLVTVEPLVLRGVGATLAGKPQLQGVDLSTEFTAQRRANAITFDVKRLDVRQGELALMGFVTSGEARLGQKPGVTAKGRLDADIGALMAQPALAPFASLSRGKVTAVFDGTVGDTVQLKAVVAGRGFVARQNGQALGDLDVTASANLKPDGSGTLSVPLTLTNAGRKSDVLIDGTFGRSPTALLFTGKLTSQQIFTDDFQVLAGLAPTSSTPTPATPRPKKDANPFWQGVNGKLDIDLKNVVYGKDYPVRSVRGTVTLTDSRLALDGLQGQLKDNPFKLGAEVKFDGKLPKPYTLAGAIDVTNLDLGEILRAANPNERPAIESKVTITSQLSGTGATLPDLIQGTYGKFDLTGGQGTLRALGKKGQTVGAVSSIIGIVGALRGSDTTMALSELTAALNELKFDSFKMHVERGADLNLKVSALEFISPLMRTTGTGGITKQGNEPVQNQPMRFDLQLGTKDQLALLLNKAGLLSDKLDDKGYMLMTYTFSIGGTPAKPDSSQLWKIIGEAAARSFLR